MTAEPVQIQYRRAGRKLRASGVVLLRDLMAHMTKVKPLRDSWGAIWLTDEEIAAGGGVAAPVPVPINGFALTPEDLVDLSKPVVDSTPARCIASHWWPLWQHMQEEHGLTLLDSECDAIADAVDASRNANVEARRK